TEYTPDRIVVKTTVDGPGLLVLADNFYDGWRATVNGQPVEILRTNHTFRGVPIAAGESEVVFEYRNRELMLGAGVTFGGMLLLAGYGAWLFAARRRSAAVIETA